MIYFISGSFKNLLFIPSDLKFLDKVSCCCCFSPHSSCRTFDRLFKSHLKSSNALVLEIIFLMWILSYFPLHFICSLFWILKYLDVGSSHLILSFLKIYFLLLSTSFFFSYILEDFQKSMFLFPFFSLFVLMVNFHHIDFTQMSRDHWLFIWRICDEWPSIIKTIGSIWIQAGIVDGFISL